MDHTRLDCLRNTLNFIKRKPRPDQAGRWSFSFQGDFRYFQPQTYHPLPLLGSCVDYDDLDSLSCVIAFEKDEDSHSYQLESFHRRLLGAARSLDDHHNLLDKTLRELLPSALKYEPQEFDGICEATPAARECPLRKERSSREYTLTRRRADFDPLLESPASNFQDVAPERRTHALGEHGSCVSIR